MDELSENGPIIGYYYGKPIYEWLCQRDEDMGMTLHFVRIADRDNDDGIPLDQLQNDERVVSPGLVYAYRAQ